MHPSTDPTNRDPRHETYRRLSLFAERADARYSAVIKARTGKTRWTLSKTDETIPEIVEAYREKRNADEAILTFMRTTR